MFSVSDSDLCPSPVDSAQLSCQHIMICLQRCQQSACTTAAYHNGLKLCILSRTEHLSPCPSPGYKSYINAYQASKSTELTITTPTADTTKAQSALDDDPGPNSESTQPTDATPTKDYDKGSTDSWLWYIIRN